MPEIYFEETPEHERLARLICDALEGGQMQDQLVTDAMPYVLPTKGYVVPNPKFTYPLWRRYLRLAHVLITDRERGS